MGNRVRLLTPKRDRHFVYGGELTRDGKAVIFAADYDHPRQKGISVALTTRQWTLIWISVISRGHVTFRPQVPSVSSLNSVRCLWVERESKMTVLCSWRSFLAAILLTLFLPSLTMAASLYPGLFPAGSVNFNRDAVNFAGSWINPPKVFSSSFDPGGGGYGITSGYSGTYVNSAGEVKVAATSLTSVVKKKGDVWDYLWTITNFGNGDFIAYFGPKPPNFLKGILKPGGTQVDSATGGPPVLLAWGGQWNPEVGAEAPELQPSAIPLPASALLLIGALGLLAASRRTSL